MVKIILSHSNILLYLFNKHLAKFPKHGYNIIKKGVIFIWMVKL